jgi:LPXTG-motif cell wall-anchored protein
MRLGVTLGTAALALTLAIAVAAPAAAAPTSWTPPVDVNADDGLAYGQQVALAPDGSLTAVWARRGGVESSRSTDGGLTWSDTVVIAASTSVSSAPQIVIDAAGTRTVVWSTDDTAAIVGSRSPDGSIWSAPVTISPGTIEPFDYVNAFDPHLALGPDGEVVALWGSIGVILAGGQFVSAEDFISSATFDGSAWSSGDRASPAGQTGARAAFLPSGDVVAVWSALYGTSVSAAVSSDDGATWSDPITISAPGLEAGGPAGLSLDLAVGPEGTLVAVWSARTAGFRVVQTASTTDGTSWSTPVTLSAADADGDDPRVGVAADGTLHAIWVRRTDSGSVVQTSASRGGPWSAPVDLSEPAEYAIPAAPVFDAQSNVTLAWLSVNPEIVVEIGTATSLDGGATFSIPVILSNSTVPAQVRYLSPPQLVVDGAGVYTAVWAAGASATAVTVQAATSNARAAVDAPAAPGTRLAATGSADAATLGVLAVALLAAGASVLRRRRSTDPLR